jgi:hypothetical protein
LFWATRTVPEGSDIHFLAASGNDGTNRIPMAISLDVLPLPLWKNLQLLECGQTQAFVVPSGKISHRKYFSGPPRADQLKTTIEVLLLSWVLLWCSTLTGTKMIRDWKFSKTPTTGELANNRIAQPTQ